MMGSVAQPKSQPKSCLVLGGGGFLGTNLCRRLRDRGHRVRAFGRRALFPRELVGIEWIPGEFSDSDALADSMSQVDVIFHLIHGVSWF